MNFRLYGRTPWPIVRDQLALEFDAVDHWPEIGKVLVASFTAALKVTPNAWRETA